MITQEELRRMLDYDPGTGTFLWKVVRHGRCRGVGCVAGSVMKSGYVTISLNGIAYYAHHLAWLWVHGVLLKHLDHEDLNKANNSICNLRPSDKSRNGMNRGPQKNNSSGYVGVCWSSRDKVWLSYIGVKRRQIRLGQYDDPVLAAKARDQAAIKYHGEFARLNFPETSCASPTLL